MKLYRNLVYAVTEGIKSILEENRQADKVVEKILKQDSRWGSRDRKFIAETIYEIVRWRRFYESAAGGNPWELVAAHLCYHHIELPDWPEWSGLQIEKIKNYLNKKDWSRAILQSIPDWLDNMGEQSLGSRWNDELNALNQMAPVTLRCNSLKISRKDLVELLLQEGYETELVENYQDAISLKKRGSIFRTQAFQEGLFEVQDAGSQAIAAFCSPEPGQRIIDACAGAGGKTLHLAALVQNKGKIIALDTEHWKLQELKKRARRAGVFNVETKTITDRKVIKRLEGQADRLLLDVPCSGLGVLKRNPDAKWKLSPDSISHTIDLQRKILSDYSLMLKPGGLMTYATCSILPQENELQVKWFRAHHPEYELIIEKHIWPSEGTDGFYMALMRKGVIQK